jgi:membrane protease YdiL (CAAX protease family)
MNPEQFFKKACVFESSLIIVALFLGWIADINPIKDLYFSETAIAIGLLGTLPLYLLFLAMEQTQADSLVKIRKLLLTTLGPGLYRYHWSDLLVLSAIAGLSEELLFRGVIQPWIASSWGIPAGLIGSNIIFGLAHALTPMYGILAMLVGIYLGLALDVSGERNLLTPIIIHGFYDFLAFLALMRAYRASINLN